MGWDLWEGWEGGLLEVCSGGWGKMGGGKYVQSHTFRRGKWSAVIFPGAEWDSGRGGTALAWILKVPSLWANSRGEPRESWSLVCAIQAESWSPRTRLSFEQKELWEKITLA